MVTFPDLAKTRRRDVLLVGKSGLEDEPVSKPPLTHAQVRRAIKAGTQGAPAPMSAKRPTDKRASGSDVSPVFSLAPRARPYVWHLVGGAPIKTY